MKMETLEDIVDLKNAELLRCYILQNKAYLSHLGIFFVFLINGVDMAAPIIVSLIFRLALTVQPLTSRTMSSCFRH